MSFTTTQLVGNRVLVQGTDFLGTEGKTVLDSSQWVEVNQQKQFKTATKEFDAAVEEFFQPLTQAAEKAQAATSKQEEDPIGFVVIDEAVEGKPGKPAHLVKLTKDSTILRILEDDPSGSRLAWVGDTLEVLAASQTASNVAVPSAQEVTELGEEQLTPTE